jgi:hypothetical protein
MKLDTFSYSAASGWSVEPLGDFDSESTLVVVFGAPDLELYKEYLGDLAGGLPATGMRFPLAIRANAAEEKRLVRTILAVEEEIEATLDELPDGTRQIGFYSYGETSPYATGPCDLHNQTMTLTTIRESAAAA